MDRISLKREFIKALSKESSDGLKFRTKGSSMWPLIETNDEIEIIYKDIHKLKLGDIILVNSNGNFIAHRIKKLFPKIITKGDNSKRNDNFIVNEKTYMGVVVSIKKNRFNITLGHNFLKNYYLCFKFFGYNIKYLNFIRKLYISNKWSKNNEKNT